MNENVAWEFAPELRHCPKSVLTGDERIDAFIGWYMDWKKFTALPYGSVDVLDEPIYVYQVFQACEDGISAHARFVKTRDAKTKPPPTVLRIVGARGRYGT